MTRILIVDDHAVVRRGLKQILEGELAPVVFGEAKNAQEAMDRVLAEPWDVMVLDISLPGKNGLDLLREVKEHRPALPVLVLSMHPEDQYAVRVLRAGAVGYMTKESAPDELVEAIRKVKQGGRYIGPSLAERLAASLGSNTGQSLHEKLSDREYQVLRMLAQGKTVSMIGRELSLSVKTISTYRSRILVKTGMSNSAQLIAYATREQLV